MMLTFAELRKSLNGFKLNKIILIYLKNLQFHSFGLIQLERVRERSSANFKFSAQFLFHGNTTY